GAILDVGCGCGYTLVHWAKKFKKTRLVGIDIDPLPLEHCKSMIEENKLNDRVEIHVTTTNKYCQEHKNQFDVVILNEVLHEMDPNEQYRINALTDIHNLLKDDGILMIGEGMIPDTYTPKTMFQFFEVWVKWVETSFPSSFYNEESIKKLFKSTSFKKVELVRDGREYCCVARK
ncbi:MAG: SAM-dependent methyltransferase, partial [Promethearchaeota archaeon]